MENIKQKAPKIFNINVPSDAGADEDKELLEELKSVKSVKIVQEGSYPNKPSILEVTGTSFEEVSDEVVAYIYKQLGEDEEASVEAESMRPTLVMENPESERS